MFKIYYISLATIIFILLPQVLQAQNKIGNTSQTDNTTIKSHSYADDLRKMNEMDVKQREYLIDSIKNDHINTLRTVAQCSVYKSQQCYSAYLLGIYNHASYIPVDEITTTDTIPPDIENSYHFWVWGYYPYLSAILNCGQNAVPLLLDKLATTDDSKTRELCLYAIVRIEPDMDIAKLILNWAINKEDAPKCKERLQLTLKAIGKRKYWGEFAPDIPANLDNEINKALDRLCSRKYQNRTDIMGGGEGELYMIHEFDEFGFLMNNSKAAVPIVLDRLSKTYTAEKRDHYFENQVLLYFLLEAHDPRAMPLLADYMSSLRDESMIYTIDSASPYSLACRAANVFIYDTLLNQTFNLHNVYDDYKILFKHRNQLSDKLRAEYKRYMNDEK